MQKRILIKFCIWIFIGVLLMFYGITHSLALTYTNIGEMRNVTQQLVSTNYGDAPFNNPVNSGYAFSDVLQVDYIVSSYNFEANKNYQLESHLSSQQLTNANSYSVTGLNGENCLISYENSIFNDAYPRWAFQCPHATNTITISIRNSSNQYLWNGTGIFNWQTALLKYSDTSLSGSGSDTDNIINNNNQNTQNIINNQNTNTQDIIDNQNKNAQDIQDTINDNFNSCRDSVNIFSGVMVQGGILPQNGELNTEPGISSMSIVSQDLIKVKPNTTYYISSKPSYNIDRIGQYGQDKTFISRSNSLNSHTFTTDSNTYYIRFNFYYNGIRAENVKEIQIQEGTTATAYEKPGKICTNKLDDTKDSIDGVKNALTDDSPVDMSSLGDTAGWLPAGPIDSIINLPLNLFNNLLNALNKTCQPINIPLPYVDRYLPIPCISTIFNQIDGLPNFWNWVGLITSVVILYRYLIALYKYYDDLTTLKANFISDFGGAP